MLRRACVADIMLGTGLDKIKRGAGDFRFRKVAAPDDVRKLIDSVVLQFAQGATIYPVRGFFAGSSEPSYVLRLIGTDRPNKGEMGCADVRAAARCIAQRLLRLFQQWEVWALVTNADGTIELFRAGADPFSEADYSACRARVRELRRAS